ncbi:hypothetical protein FQN54_005139 [Arachnomyces sp. PD_36]|nr:hypothetical protein FQN54_005139 [Arachnomyces sp. PD_36]
MTNTEMSTHGRDKHEELPFNLTDLDREVLSQTDEEFVCHDWAEMRKIVATNSLEALKRKPSDLVRYIKWSSKTKAEYGSVGNYIGQRRLQWFPITTTNATATTTIGTSNPSSTSSSPAATGTTPLTTPTISPSPTPNSHTPLSFKNPIPFADPDDYRILRNDWPYGFTPDIVHLVVWLKTPIETDPVTGVITEASHALIDKFVKWKFVERLRRLQEDKDKSDTDDVSDRVLWCKNWTALQSVRSLEHIHVFVRNVPDEVIVEWTGDKGLVQG